MNPISPAGYIALRILMVLGFVLAATTMLALISALGRTILSMWGLA